MGINCGGIQRFQPGLTRTSPQKAKPKVALALRPLRFQGHEDQVIISKPTAQVVTPHIQTVIPNVRKFNPQDPDSVKYYQTLLLRAQSLARPEVSGRRVGAIAIGASGTAYLGFNREIKGGAPSDVIHAEAAAFAMAKANGEKGVVAMVQTLQPCGSCRQVLAEGGNPELPVHLLNPAAASGSQPVETMIIGALYPKSYSYGTTEKNIFKSPTLKLPPLPPGELEPLLRAAHQAAKQSYLPNPDRKAWSGLAAKTQDGDIFTGRVITVAGPNPSITPVQDLLIQMAMRHRNPDDLTEAVLIEPKDPDYSFYNNTKAVFERLAPQLQCNRVKLSVDTLSRPSKPSDH